MRRSITLFFLVCCGIALQDCSLMRSAADTIGSTFGQMSVTTTDLLDDKKHPDLIEVAGLTVHDTTGDFPLARVYCAEADGQPVKVRNGQLTDGRWYHRVDVRNVYKYPTLTATGETTPADLDLKRRQLLYVVLMASADHNTRLYMDRFSSILRVADSTEKLQKAILGGAIATAFISPVLSAVLGGIALAEQTFRSAYTGGYSEESAPLLRANVLAEQRVQREAIRAHLADPYENYTAEDLIRDVERYHRVPGLLTGMYTPPTQAPISAGSP